MPTDPDQGDEHNRYPDREPSLNGATVPVPTGAARLVAFLEVLLCSDFPTQLVLAATFAFFGFRPLVDGSLNLTYVAVLSFADTVLLLGLVLVFLKAHGEDPRATFFGDRPVLAEARAGIPLLFVAFGVAIAVMLAAQTFAPWLHTVPRNPLEDLVNSPVQAAVFALVLIVAGGIREEVQRAFLLRRFEQWLGGARVGLVLTSLAFGAGHFIQGADAAVATAALGAFWGWIYLKRRSIAAPVVSHAGFNLVQIVQYLTFSR